jgi:hypothetical protein
MPLARWLGFVAALALCVPTAGSGASARLLCTHNQLFPEFVDHTEGRPVLVVVDRTVHFSDQTIASFLGWTMAVIQGGDDVEIASFSALTPRYALNVDLRVHVKGPLSEQDLQHITGFSVARQQQCRATEIADAKARIRGRLNELARNPVEDDVRSEIVETLARLSIEGTGRGPEHDPIMIVASDMLENATGPDSFYRSANLRPGRLRDYLDSEASLGFLGHLDGVRVYVIGAATPAEGKTPLAPAERQYLQGFWCNWFRRSNAHIADWGTGALIQDPRRIDSLAAKTRSVCASDLLAR